MPNLKATPAQAKRLVSAVTRVERTYENDPTNETLTRSAWLAQWIAKTPSGGIPEMSSSDCPGSATCELYKFNSSDCLTIHNDEQATPVAVDVTVWNKNYVPIPGDIYIHVYQELLTGKYLAILVGGGTIIKTTTAISAATATIAGTGTANLEYIDTTSTPTANAFTVWKSNFTIYNACKIEVPNNTRGQAKLDFHGRLIVDVECCVDT